LVSRSEGRTFGHTDLKLQITCKDNKTGKHEELYFSPNTVCVIKYKKMRWTGHMDGGKSEMHI